jgi:hypothetical protein
MAVVHYPDRLRDARAEGAFIERLRAVYDAERAGGPDGFDAERLLDRFRDLLTSALTPDEVDHAIQDIAADLYGDDRWAAADVG